MALFTLDEEHPLTKAGLRVVHVVEQVEPALKPGDVVFEFPYGRIVDTGMACRRERIIPPGVEIMTIHQEAIAARASYNRQGQEGEHMLRGERPRLHPCCEFGHLLEEPTYLDDTPGYSV